jgi:hypothetical protein
LNVVIAAPGIDLGEVSPLYFDVCLVLEPLYAHRCIDLHQRGVDACARALIFGNSCLSHCCTSLMTQRKAIEQLFLLEHDDDLTCEKLVIPIEGLGNSACVLQRFRDNACRLCRGGHNKTVGGFQSAASCRFHVPSPTHRVCSN